MVLREVITLIVSNKPVPTIRPIATGRTPDKNALTPANLSKPLTIEAIKRIIKNAGAQRISEDAKKSLKDGKFVLRVAL